MADYSNEYSSFPDSLITIHKFKNVDDNVAPLFTQINLLRTQGDFEQAQQIIQQYNLSEYCPDAVTINTIIEEIYNAQVFAKQVQQLIYFNEDEEPEADTEDVWISPCA